jgi:Domain of unknown function (DUF4388)
MALEGRLRDLALTEVLQLLALGRKTGVLHCHAPLQGRRAQIAFNSGAIIDADVAGVDRVNDLAAPRRRTSDRTAMEDAVQDVLLWRDGTFRFAPGERPTHDTTVRLAVEPLLMDAAMRAEVWRHIESRVPHARVIPAFVEVEPQQLPLLRLSPPQWEILTCVDGQRDLMALASAMQRDVTEVAKLVFDLMGSGLLTLREGQTAPRQNPTPPATPVIPTVVPAPADSGPDFSPGRAAAVTGADLWIPSMSGSQPAQPFGDLDEDSLFDPIALGVLTPEGLPRQKTPWAPAEPVAPTPTEPSFPGEQLEVVATGATLTQDGRTLCQQGDELARTGDLVGAMAHWNAALRAPAPLPNAERVREAVALAARLHALLHS